MHLPFMNIAFILARETSNRPVATTKATLEAAIVRMLPTIMATEVRLT